MLSFRSPVFSALDSIQVGDRVRLSDATGLPAQIANWGSGTVDVGADARTGSILSVGPVSLRDRSGVDGSIQTGATVARGAATSVVGTVVEKSAPSLPTAPSITSTWPSSPKAGFTVDAGTQSTRYAGAYGNVIVRSNALLILAPGAYWFASLLIETGGIVRLGGNTSLEIRDSLTLRGQFLNSSGDVHPVCIRCRGTAAVVVERSFRGSILCPSASLTLGSNGAMSYVGQFLGKQLVVRPDCTATPEIPWDGGLFAPPPTRTTTPALVATHGFVLGAGVVFQNPAGGLIGIYNTGSEPVRVGPDSQVGPVTSVGPIQMGTRATADGDLTSSSSIRLETGASATGSVTPNGNPVFPALSTTLTTWPAESLGDRVVPASGQTTLAAGSYGAVEVGSGAKLVLTGTHYWFRNLSLPQDAVIQAGTGTVIETDDRLSLRGKVVDSNGNPVAVQVIHHGTGSIEIHGPFPGTVLAPHATLVVDGTSGIFAGQAIASSIEIMPGSVFGSFTGSVPSLFTTPTTPTDPIRRTFTGTRKVVLPIDSPANVRLVVNGSASATPVVVLPGQSAWINPQDGLPWTLQVETRGSDGTWTAVASSDGVTSTAGKLTVSTVAATLPSGTVQVEVQGQTPSASPERWIVTGTVTWTDGTPFRGLVTAYDKDLLGSQFLGAAQTGESGSYTVEFLREQFTEVEYGSPDVYIQASTIDVGGKTTLVHGASDPVFNAPSRTTIDLQLEGRELSLLSEFERIDILIRPLLSKDGFADLQTDEHYEFASRELSEPVEHIRLFIQAQRQSAALADRIASGKLGPEAAIDPMAFHGLYRQGLPVSLELLCRRTKEELEAALMASDSQRIIALRRLGAVPSDIAASLASLLRSHETLHLKSLFKRFFGEGDTPVLNPTQISAITDLQQAHAGDSRGFWAALRARIKTSESDTDWIFENLFAFQRWQMQMSALQLAGGNASLQGQLMGRISPDATDLSELARLSAYEFRICLDNGSISSHTSDSEKDRLARGLRATVVRAYTREAVAYAAAAAESVDITVIQPVLRQDPTLDPREPAPSDSVLLGAGVDIGQLTAFRSQWDLLRRHLALYPVPLAATGSEARRAELVSLLATHTYPYAFTSSLADPLAEFLRGSTGFKFGRDKVASLLEARATYLATLQSHVAEEIRAWVRVAGRLLALRPDPDALKQLRYHGYKTATQIARASRSKFQDSMADSGLSPEVVGEIHRAARRLSRTAAHLHGTFQSASTELPIFALGGARSAQDDDPDWSNLFQRPVTTLVPDWRSVLGPAAYFVDVLRYLESLPTPLGRTQPFQALIHRRPDLVHIALDRAGTFDLVSHSQLVLEILQAYVAHSGTWTPSLWTSLDPAAIQEQADHALATGHAHPFDLPVDALRHDQELLLGLLGLHLADLAPTLGHDGSDAALDRIAKDALEISSSQRSILLASSVDDTELCRLWGVDSLDPDPTLPATSRQTTVSNSVPTFLERAGISFVELCRYSATRWAGGAIQVPSADGADLSTLQFPAPLSHLALHRATRFLRLLAVVRRLDPALGCHELDAALHALGPDLDATFLRRLGSVVRTKRRFSLGWFETLSLFAAPDTAHGRAIGEDGDLVETPSWHEQVWRLLDRHPDADFLVAETTGELVKTTLTLSRKADAIRRILGLDAFQWSAILKALSLDPDTAGSFTAANLAAIRRVVVLSRALGATPEVLALRSGILGTSFPPTLDGFDAFLEGNELLASLSASVGNLRFLFADSVAGPGSVTPISKHAQKLLEEILQGLSTVEAGLAGLVGPDIDSLRTSQQSDSICQILARELKSETGTILDLLSMRLHLAAGPHGPPPSVLSDLLRLDGTLVGDPATAQLDRFKRHLVRLQKSVLLVDLLGLSTAELDVIQGDGASWGGFDLDGLSTDLDGSTDTSLPWFVPVLRYANTRDRIGSDLDPSDSGSLANLWTATLDSGKLAALSGFHSTDIAALAAARFGSSVVSNSVLHSLLPGLELLGTLGASATQVLGWAAQTDGLAGTTSEIATAVKGRFDDDAWTAAEAKYLVASRNFRRENLVKYVLEMSDLPAGVDTLDKLYEFFLIDVGMDAAQTTSRVAQAIATIQQFVQRCLMNLERDLHDRTPGPGDFPGVSPASFDPARWAWLKNYRVWEANRRVFLFPENYVEPELRPDKSEFFVELEKELSESTLSGESIEAAFGHYLTKLESVARLKVVAHGTDPDNDVLHVVGRTDDLPGIHYHRTRSKDGIWTGWTRMPLDIPSDHLMPVFNNRRLYLYWLEFAEKATDPSDGDLAASGSGHQGARPQKHWEITLAWTEYRNGKWSPRVSTAMESGTSDQPSQGSTLRVPGLQVESASTKATNGKTANPDTSGLLKHPSEYRLIADLQAFQSLGGALVPRIPLRLLEAAHSAYKIAVPRVVTEKVRQTHKLMGWKVSTTYTTRSYVVTDIVDSKSFYSRLSEAGSWWINRPGGRLVPEEARLKDLQTVLRTGVDWVNQFQSWSFEGPLLIPFPMEWCEDGSRDAAGENVARILDGTSSGTILFDPADQSARYAAPWRPFFFSDGIRDYYVEARLRESHRRISRAIPAQAGSEAVADPNLIEPARALMVSPPATKDPFFLSNSGEYFSDLNNAGIAQTSQSLLLRFSTHYHPFATSLLSKLVAGGVDQVLSPLQQTDPGDGAGGYFETVLKPGSLVSKDFPLENHDFSLDGAYSLYNWELFFHIPLLLATRLTREKRFEEARRWFHYVFDPTTDEGNLEDSSQRLWKFAPFAQDSDSGRVDETLSLYSKSEADLTEEQRMAKRRMEDQVAYSSEHPFEPHGIARLRLSAYRKSVFMKYVDNLLEWADQLFMAYTRESVNEATQLYVLAKDLLGPAPELVPLDPVSQPPDYAALRDGLAQDGDPLAPVEDWISDNTMDTADVDPDSSTESDGHALAGPAASTFFKVPSNEKLSAYWGTVDDRLYKIRHGLDIDGVARPLALFAPRLDPADLVGAAGSDPLAAAAASTSAPVPLYRFSSLLPKALEYCNEVKSFGGALLSALEKNDAEGLSLLRSRQEIALHKLVRTTREEQVSEAETALETLRKTRATVQARLGYYKGLVRRSDSEKKQLEHLEISTDFQVASQLVNVTAGIWAALPDFQIGVSGFGGSPSIIAKTGGSNLSGAVSATATGLGMLASIESMRSTRAGMNAGWERRDAEWDHQANQAELELRQIDSQIEGAQARVRIAKGELASLELQLRSSQEVETFMNTKFTNQELFGWLASRLSGLYLKAFQSAFQLAKQVEAAFRHERRTGPSVGITYEAWNGLRRGLLSGETLGMDLRRLELEFMNSNVRDPEITRTVSLVSLDAGALVALRTTGKCGFALPEALFDLDHPGHFHRRIKHVTVTIPCVTGPYSGVNGKLVYRKGRIRTSDAAAAGSSSIYPKLSDTDLGPAAFGPVVLSGGQNDSGMFEPNLRDERYLPFEGCGLADSEWVLEIPRATNGFDLETISDVLLRIQYTAAISTASGFADAALDAASLSQIDFVPGSVAGSLPSGPVRGQSGQVRLFSLRHEFADAWHAWIRDMTGTVPLEIPLDPSRFPFQFRGKAISVSKVGIAARTRDGSVGGLDKLSVTAGSLSVSGVGFHPQSEFDGLPFASADLKGDAAVPGTFVLGVTGKTPTWTRGALDDLYLMVLYKAE